jgi:hypothetical protein
MVDRTTHGAPITISMFPPFIPFCPPLFPAPALPNMLLGPGVPGVMDGMPMFIVSFTESEPDANAADTDVNAMVPGLVRFGIRGFARLDRVGLACGSRAQDNGMTAEGGFDADPEKGFSCHAG